MKATLNKHLHERALAIIELIDTADQRIKIQEQNIKDMKGHFFYTKETCEAKIASLVAAKQWLNRAYRRTILRIIDARPSEK